MSEHPPPSDRTNVDLTAVRVQRARDVDPAASDFGVQRFWQEIEEARLALDTVEAEAAPLRSAFSAFWPDQDRP